MAARKGSSNGKSNGRSNGHSNGHANGKSSGKAKRAPVMLERAQAVRGRPTRGAESHPTVRPKGTLIMIGGQEDKEGDKLVLRRVVQNVGSGRLVVASIASDLPRDMWEQYEQLFRGLGARHVYHLQVETREEAKHEAKLRILDDATVVFFTGGDQLKLTSLLGDSPIYERVKEIYERGGTIVGTSAGASVVCETMLVSGSGDESHRIGSALRMAPGFGLIAGVIVDQHFAQRGRIGRLLGAVAQNPRMLGIGIDEDTAVVCDPRSCFEVIGRGAVYVLDGQDISYTNLTAEEDDRTLSAFGMHLHVLSMGDRFEMLSRQPEHRAAEEVEEEIMAGR